MACCGGVGDGYNLAGIAVAIPTFPTPFRGPAFKENTDEQLAAIVVFHNVST